MKDDVVSGIEEDVQFFDKRLRLALGEAGMDCDSGPLREERGPSVLVEAGWEYREMSGRDRFMRYCESSLLLSQVGYGKVVFWGVT